MRQESSARRSKYTSCFAASVLAALICLNAAAATKAKPVWILNSAHFGSGKYRYFVTADAIKIENIDNGGIMLAKAPTWRVSCYRDKGKLEWTAPLDKFDRSSLFALIPHFDPSKKAKIILLGKEKLQGLNCLKYEMQDRSLIWISPDIQAAPQTAEVVARYFSSPNLNAIPIKFVKPKPRKQNKPDLSHSITKMNADVPWLSFKHLSGGVEAVAVDITGWKKVPYNPADFEYPKGYKRTSDLKEVVVSDQHKQTILNLMDDIGMGSSPNSKIKPK